ncbi:VirD4-like conjugal transfer protein, CD1115 family [Tepidanaerobacter acetatoxydans]|uniref:VirD4-like conjugal transfer protein, CD1115 family n=1 Tax=Tepidanaerobacter acetatoxydans TaxID=499229 RepID=UPI001BD1D028|nr:type IV secretory system conjugative DNA transfer family protein [Tepidanaerobacter acetatoxydans]
MDYIGLAFVYMVPKVIWPPIKPAMTVEEAVSYLAAKSLAPNTGYTNHFVITQRLFTERPMEFWIAQIPFIFILCIILVIFYRTGWPYRRPALLMSKETTHGSSRWRKPKELLKTLVRVDTEKPAAAGIVVGSQGDTAWVTKPDVGNPHTFIIGSTRSGKSRRVIMPSIWTIGNALQSMILSDPKGELFQHTSAWLRQKGYDVILIDLLRPSRGNRWNPLDVIVRALKEGDKEEAVRQAWELGNQMAWSKGPGNDPIWPQAEESLIAALFLAVAIEATEGKKNPTNAYNMLLELGAEGGEELDYYFAGLPAGHPAKMAYGTAALSEARTRSSIYTGTAAHLRLFSETGIEWLCAESDHDPRTAGQKPTAIFLLMPDEAGARRDIAAMYINQAYSSLASLARDNGGSLPLPVWILLDEFGNIGKIPNMAEKLTVAAGRNIRFVMAVQGIDQVEKIYGRQEANIVTGNCDTWLYLRTNDSNTRERLSRMAGTVTVRTKSMQKRKVDVSESEGTTQRFLLTADEVGRWQMGNSLLIQAGQYPAQLSLEDISAWKAAYKAFFPGIDMPEAKPIGEGSLWLPQTEKPEKEVVHQQIEQQNDNGNILNDLQV